MRFIRLVIFHIKRIIKTPSLLVSLFLAPLLLSIFMSFTSGSGDSGSVGKSAFIFEDQNEGLKNEMLKELEESEDNLLMADNLDEGLELLDNSQVQLVYYIPENFIQNRLQGRDNSIEVYSLLGEESDPVLDLALSNAAYSQLQKSAWSETGVEADQIIAEEVDFVQISYENESVLSSHFGGIAGGMFGLLIMYGPGLAIEYVNFRKSQVLKRLAVSPNKSWISLGSLLLSYGIVLMLAAICVCIFCMTIDIVDSSQVPLFLAYYAAMVVFSLSFSLLLFRIFKDEKIVTGLGIAIGMLLLIMSSLPLFMANNDVASLIAHFSPLYWTFDGLVSGYLFPGIPAILLMAALLFTAGSYRLEDFAVS